MAVNRSCIYFFVFIISAIISNSTVKFNLYKSKFTQINEFFTGNSSHTCLISRFNGTTTNLNDSFSFSSSSFARAGPIDLGFHQSRFAIIVPRAPPLGEGGQDPSTFPLPPVLDRISNIASYIANKNIFLCFLGKVDYFKISLSTIHQFERFEVRNSKIFLGRDSPSPLTQALPLIGASPSNLRRLTPSIRASPDSDSPNF